MPMKGPYYNFAGKLTNMKKMNDKEWLFQASCEEVVVVVKFVRSYGKDVHELLAAKKLAPELYSVEPLCGEWQAVVMEKVDGKSADKLWPDAVSRLEEALDLMHNHNYVHGDLRPQNTHVTDSSVYVLDFDWAGTEGTVSYPTTLNTAGNWHPDVLPGGPVCKEHDTYQFKWLRRWNMQ